MFLHEIRAALSAESGSPPSSQNNDAELMARIMELVSAGDVTTVGPAYIINKK
jgi:hypothetical protein